MKTDNAHTQSQIKAMENSEELRVLELVKACLDKQERQTRAHAVETEQLKKEHSAQLEQIKKKAQPSIAAIQAHITELKTTLALQKAKNTQLSSDLEVLKESVEIARLEQEILNVKSVNIQLKQAVETSKKLHLEKEQAQCREHQHWLEQQRAEYEAHTREAHVQIHTLGGALEYSEARLAQCPLALRVPLSGPMLHLLGDLGVQLDANPFLVTKLLSLSLDLNKAFSERDDAIVRQALSRLLLTENLTPYLGVLSATVNHRYPDRSFRRIYNQNIYAQLIPLRWPLPLEPVTQDWLAFIAIKLSALQTPSDPYEILTLLLVAPYCVFAQTRLEMPLKTSINTFVIEFVQCLPNLNKPDRILLANRITVGLNRAIIEFQGSRSAACAQVVSLPAAPPVVVLMGTKPPLTSSAASSVPISVKKKLRKSTK